MSVWSSISDTFANFTGEGIAGLLESLRTPPEKSVAFTIAVISLGAKMAKADGLVTKDEVAAFREVFHIASRYEDQAAHVFNYARQDVAGYEVYANQLARMFSDNETAKENIVEGLFHIAVADGKYHPAEDDFVHTVAQKFEISERAFRAIRTRFVPDAKADAYDVLGVTPDMDIELIRDAWRKAIRDTHPDTMVSKGLPEEAITMATKRMIDVNKAWEEIYERH
ncbi:MAG: molecular chaperone DjiA [Pseudomonadota bacterium]